MVLSLAGQCRVQSNGQFRCLSACTPLTSHNQCGSLPWVPSWGRNNVVSRQVPGTRLGRALPHHLIEVPTVVPTAARRASEMRVEPSDRRTSLPMICGAIRVERSETVVLHRFYHLWRLVVHDRPPLSLIGSEHYHCPTAECINSATLAGGCRTQRDGRLVWAQGAITRLGQKEAPRRGLEWNRWPARKGVIMTGPVLINAHVRLAPLLRFNIMAAPSVTGVDARPRASAPASVQSDVQGPASPCSPTTDV